MSVVFESIKVGNWDLPQRFVMAPLTRNRAGKVRSRKASR